MSRIKPVCVSHTYVLSCQACAVCQGSCPRQACPPGTLLQSPCTCLSYCCRSGYTPWWWYKLLICWSASLLLQLKLILLKVLQWLCLWLVMQPWQHPQLIRKQLWRVLLKVRCENTLCSSTLHSCKQFCALANVCKSLTDWLTDCWVYIVICVAAICSLRLYEDCNLCACAYHHYTYIFSC